MSEELDSIALQKLQEAMGTKSDGDDLVSVALLASVRIRRLKSVIDGQEKEIERLNGVLDNIKKRTELNGSISEHVCGLQGFGAMDTCQACQEMFNGRSLQK